MTPTTHDRDVPQADATLECFTRQSDGPAACATLTPLIKAKLRELDPGQILEVRVDDPSARIDVPAWSRLAGHELLATVDSDSDQLSFYLRKKQT